MSFPGLPDCPITPILMGKGVSAINRNLPFKPPFASTPISRSPRNAAKDKEMGKGKPAMVLTQQNEAAAVKPLKSRNSKSSEVANILQSKLLGGRNQLLGLKPVSSEVKGMEGDAGTIQAAVERLVAIGKTVSKGMEKTAAMSRGDAQRKLGGQVETKASLVAESKGKEKGHTGLRSGRVITVDHAIKVASGPRKGAEKSGRRDENVPGLDERNQSKDSRVGQLSTQSSLNALQGKLESVHKVTKTASKSTGSRVGNGKEADQNTPTSQPTASKGLPPKIAKSGTGSAQVNSNSDLRTAKTDSVTNRNPTETKSLTRAPNSRSSETKENKLKGKSADKIKSVVAQTAGSTNVVKTTAYRSSGRVDNVCTAEKELVSVTNVSRVEIPGVKASAKITSQLAASRVSATQSVDSKGLTSHGTDSVFTNSDSIRSKSSDRETLAGRVRPASVKTRGVKRVASPEISSDLDNSTEASDRSIPNKKPKKLRVVTENAEEDLPSTSTQPERRFLKQKISKPKKLLPNSSQEKAIKQAQHIDRRRSIEQRDIELKVKPKIYQRWKVASKPTIEFVMGTLMQSFGEKFKSQKVDLVDMMKCFEELKTRITSEVSLVKVPTSRQPVNYLALTTQEATLKKHLDELLMDVGLISLTIRNCERANEKLKLLKERLESKRITTSEAERLYEEAHEQSRSTVGSLHVTEQSNVLETQED